MVERVVHSHSVRSSILLPATNGEGSSEKERPLQSGGSMVQFLLLTVDPLEGQGGSGRGERYDPLPLPFYGELAQVEHVFSFCVFCLSRAVCKRLSDC